ncbi:hypothetical protein SDC9_178942 [bioreactor metagenome]|uniref:Uncharacterized protein n=1 Tax=bioreactor metagenome TaxID=1076179 RepID=A0A645GXL4_9ZZZZ
MPCISAINCKVNDSSNTVTILVFDAQLFHQLAVASRNGGSIYLGHDAMTTDLLNIRHAAAINLFAISAL